MGQPQAHIVLEVLPCSQVVAQAVLALRHPRHLRPVAEVLAALAVAQARAASWTSAATRREAASR